MGSFEKLQDDTIETVTNSVPTDEDARAATSPSCWRSACRFSIRATARLVNGVVTRDPFPGNIIPDRPLNPIALNVLKYFPAAEPGRPTPTCRTTSSSISRGPTATTSRWCASITNGRRSSAPTAAASATSGVKSGSTSPARSTASTSRTAAPTGSTSTSPFGHTAVLSPSMFLDVKGSWLRFNDDLKPIGQLDPSELGLSGEHAGAAWRLPAHSALLASSRARPPRPAGWSTLGAQQSGFNTGRAQPFYNMQFAPTLTWTRGEHTLQVRLRLAAAAPDGGQRGLARRRVRVRRHLHARVEHGRQPVRPGHRGVHARAFR